MKKYSYVIFDLDGTLLDTLRDLGNAVNYVLKNHGEPERTMEEIRSFVGNGNRRLMARALSEGESHPGFDDMLNEFFEYYLSHMDVETVPYDGIMELLRECKSRNIATAVVTNKFHEAAKNLSQKYFGELIAVTVGDSEGRRRKPAPDNVLKAIEELGASAENTLYIGDSPVDHETAKNTGLDCILCTWGFCPKEELEKYDTLAIIDSPGEILRFL